MQSGWYFGALARGPTCAVASAPIQAHVRDWLPPVQGGGVHLSAAAGHSSLDMVEPYLDIAEADAAEAHRRASPVDNWHL
jgi:hypothetical protein